jgi:hypothetical protein
MGKIEVAPIDKVGSQRKEKECYQINSFALLLQKQINRRQGQPGDKAYHPRQTFNFQAYIGRPETENRVEEQNKENKADSPFPLFYIPG